MDRSVMLHGLADWSRGFPEPSFGQDKPLKKITWGQTSIASSQWIPWIANDSKLYEKNGLDAPSARRV